ncbi:nuclear transcription factor Y subunit B-1-like [Trifolium pratense]|uniref:nuclear transcription factor Y subunit B-1-like n=1 Tax=Trifolium pratense TaxID=57577 RepID=UPI001E695C30|nr:nuclear transcription factor Y subunit B-1-like [Trifolium pratense]
MAGNKRNQTSPVGSPTSGNISDSSSSKEQDRFLPIANVSRIMKRALPANAKISKEAKETVQECVSEFISFITGEASDKCQREKRKTINGDDLLWAMTTLGFENYVGPLKVYLNNYRETEGEKSNSSSMVTSTKQDDYDLNNSSIDVNHDVVVGVGGGGGFYSHVIDHAPKRFQEINGAW